MRCYRALIPTLPIALVGPLLFTAGCDRADVLSPSARPEAPPPAAAVQKASRSTADVLTFATQEKVGTSRLVRTDRGVSFRLSTSGLEPGTVHTLWMVVFNEPESCTAPGCGGDDLFNADAKPDLVYAAGHVIGGSGRATFAGHQNEGAADGSIMSEWLDRAGHGLLDARGAEIHFVVHSHGPVIPELVSEMLHTFNAGCGPDFIEGLPPVPESLGTHGPNTCEDVQFAVHPPSE